MYGMNPIVGYDSSAMISEPGWEQYTNQSICESLGHVVSESTACPLYLFEAPTVPRTILRPVAMLRSRFCHIGSHWRFSAISAVCGNSSDTTGSATLTPAHPKYVPTASIVL